MYMVTVYQGIIVCSIRLAVPVFAHGSLIRITPSLHRAGIEADRETPCLRPGRLSSFLPCDRPRTDHEQISFLTMRLAKQS